MEIKTKSNILTAKTGYCQRERERAFIPSNKENRKRKKTAQQIIT